MCAAVVVDHANTAALDGPTSDDLHLPARPSDDNGDNDVGGINDDELELVEAEPLDDNDFNDPTVATAMALPPMAASAAADRNYDALDAPTERIKTGHHGALASEAPTIAVAATGRGPLPVEFSDQPPTGPEVSGFGGSLPTFGDAAHQDDPFAPRLTAPIHHNGIFRSATDAVILGDAGDIAGSLLAEQPAADVDDSHGETGQSGDDAEGFLTERTDAKRRVLVPVQVYIGRDIAEALTPEIVLRVKDGVDVNWIPLSPFERFVVKEFDGVRPLARVQARLQLGTEIKLAVALLLDKQVIAPIGVALKTASAPGAVAAMTAVGNTSPRDNAGDQTASVAAARKPHSLLASMLDEAPVDVGPRPTPVPGDDAGHAAHAVHDPVHEQATMLLDGGAIPRDPRKGAWLHAQALQCITAGDVARAWQLACLACQADPDNTRFRATVDRWAEVVATAGSEDARLYALAIRRESLGDKVGAMAALRQAIAVNDKNAGAWNRLGLLLITLDKDLDAASAAFERATLLAPDDATFRNNHDKAVDAAERRRPGGGPRVNKPGNKPGNKR